MTTEQMNNCCICRVRIAASMQKVFPEKNIELGIIWTHSAELMKIDVNTALSSIEPIRMT